MDVKLCEEYKVCYSGLPCGSESKEFACNAGDQGLIPESGRSLGEGNWQPTPVFLPGKFHGQGSLMGYSSWGRKESYATNTFISLFKPTV